MPARRAERPAGAAGGSGQRTAGAAGGAAGAAGGAGRGGTGGGAAGAAASAGRRGAGGCAAGAAVGAAGRGGAAARRVVWRARQRASRCSRRRSRSAGGAAGAAGGVAGRRAARLARRAARRQRGDISSAEPRGRRHGGGAGRRGGKLRGPDVAVLQRIRRRHVEQQGARDPEPVQPARRSRLVQRQELRRTAPPRRTLRSMLVGTIAANDVFVVCHTGANTELAPLCDLLAGGISFNGDDAVEIDLRRDAARCDRADRPSAAGWRMGDRADIDAQRHASPPVRRHRRRSRRQQRVFARGRVGGLRGRHVRRSRQPGLRALTGAPPGPSSPPSTRALPPGRASFNRGDFFAAHELWEDVWHDLTGDERLLVAGPDPNRRRPPPPPARPAARGPTGVLARGLQQARATSGGTAPRHARRATADIAARSPPSPATSRAC